MKHFVCVILCACVFFSCSKQQADKKISPEIPSAYLANAEAYLKTNLSSFDYASIDFSKTNISRGENICWLQFGFKDMDATKDFIVLQTDTLGKCVSGRIIHLEKDVPGNSVFNGKLGVQSLSHQQIISSAIANGYVAALHPRKFATVTTNGEPSVNLLPSPVQELPEVIVVGYTSTVGAKTVYKDYISFQQIINGGSSQTGTIGGLSGTYSSIGSSAGGLGLPSLNTLQVNYETSFSKPGIDVAAYMKCFSAVPDAGAECTISIFTDLPVNNDPSIFFDWMTGATGHCFLQLTKATGMQSVTQIIGFTAQKPFAAITQEASVAGKLVDNTGHKYNAYLTMDISLAQLRAAINEIQFLAGAMAYNIAKYNCVDFALQVMNTIRGVNPLIIPKFQIPGQTFSASNTPEGLYRLLQSMQAAAGPESKNISVGGVLHAGTSHGPCN